MIKWYYEYECNILYYNVGIGMMDDMNQIDHTVFDPGTFIIGKLWWEKPI